MASIFTATINEWQPLLTKENYKDVIVETLQFLVKDGRIKLYGFVVMSNHVHIIWQPLQDYSLTSIQSSFMRQTAKQILKLLSISDNEMLEKMKVSVPAGFSPH